MLWLYPYGGHLYGRCWLILNIIVVGEEQGFGWRAARAGTGELADPWRPFGRVVPVELNPNFVIFVSVLSTLCG